MVVKYLAYVVYQCLYKLVLRAPRSRWRLVHRYASPRLTKLIIENSELPSVYIRTTASGETQLHLCLFTSLASLSHLLLRASSVVSVPSSVPIRSRSER